MGFSHNGFLLKHHSIMASRKGRSNPVRYGSIYDGICESADLFLELCFWDCLSCFEQNFEQIRQKYHMRCGLGIGRYSLTVGFGVVRLMSNVCILISLDHGLISIILWGIQKKLKNIISILLKNKNYSLVIRQFF